MMTTETPGQGSGMRAGRLPYDPDSGRYGYCTGHVAGEQGSLYYVHPADCPLHPKED